MTTRGRMATTVPRNLDQLKRKLQRFTADSAKSLRKGGFEAAPGLYSVIPPWPHVRQAGRGRVVHARPPVRAGGIRMGGIFAGLFAGAVLAQAGNIILAFACL
jgi:hypothetical protein